MFNNNLLKTILIILIIFSIGFILRVDSTSLPNVSDQDKAYFEDDNGVPYMYELDSYYNYRLTKNLVEHGYIGETLVNGRQWDTHSYSPPGVPMDYPPLLPYLGAIFYYLVNNFGNIPLLVSCFWLPAFIGPLAGVVCYLFLRRFTNEYGAVSAGILLNVVPYYFMRTVPGWYDTDMFNIIFPLLVVWFFVEALQSDNIRNRIIFTILASSSMFLFSLAWNGWQYMFYLLVIFSLFYFIWGRIRGNRVKNSFQVLGAFTILTLVLLILFSGYLSLINLVFSTFELIFTDQNTLSYYPNVYLMVSELYAPSLKLLISNIGISLFSGLLGLIWIYRFLINKKLKNKYLNKMNWFFFTFLVVWTIVGIITLWRGSRFILMLIPPLVLTTGLLVGLVAEHMNTLQEKILEREYSGGKSKYIERITRISQAFFNKNYSLNLISLLLVFIIVLSAIASVNSSNFVLIPGINDDLWDAAQWINNETNTPKDGVIITGWTWGHFYTAIADRPIVFDGRMGYIETLSKRNFDDAYIYGKKSPGTSREYWIDKAFSSNNETLSMGIFRMLATSGDLGYLTLDGYTKNATKSVEILNNILGVDRQSALSILKEDFGFNEDQAQNILNYSHPSNPKPVIIVTNNEMIGKGFWMFYYGVGWDFNKQQSKEITYSIVQMNFTNNSIVKSKNGVEFDPKTGQVTWNNTDPYCVIRVSSNGTETTYINESSDFSIILLMDDNQTVIMDKGFENSLFTKLVMEKENTAHFKSIFRKNSVTIWEIRE